jgi:3-(3-hydroxy-phenyl)propionate hydroxylase
MMSFEFKEYSFRAKRYQAKQLILADAVETKRHQVAIIGAGPVGLALALGLANYGVASVLIEADDSVCFGSRAICISRRSSEIIERLGALPEFLEKGLPWTGGRSFYRDAEVLRFEMPHDENQKLPPMLNIEQYYIEQFLLNAAEKRADLIDIRWETRATGLRAQKDGATLCLSTPNADYTLQADWLVACDGGRSQMREALGLQLQGTSYEGRYVIVDIELNSDLPTERLAWFDPPSNPGSTILMHKQPDNIWRIDYQLRDEEDPEEAVKPENVIPRVRSHLEMMGERRDWSPIWIAIYRAHALSLESYRHGRVLFAGDAAHLVPIFGVRGANSGIDDADNLAWKLAFVVKGLASDRLLDTYSQERVFATEENLSYGTKSTEFMAPPSFAFKLMRQAVLSLAVKHCELRSLINPRQSAAISYVESPLNSAAERSAEFSAGPQPGAVLLECPLSIVGEANVREAYLTDLVGRRFTAFYFTEAGVIPEELMALDGELSRGPMPFKLIPVTRHLPHKTSGLAGWDHTGKLFALYGAQPGSLYLVRPDGHVLGRWRVAAPDVILTALAHVMRPQSQAEG